MPVLLGSKCSSCGYVSYPKKIACPRCGTKTMKEERLSGRAKLYSYTVTYVGQPGVKVPYVLGMVDLVEGPRVLAQIAGIGGEYRKLHLGMEMQSAQDRKGFDRRRVVFKPIR